MRRQYICRLWAAAPEAVGFGEKPVLTVFPEVDAASPRGLMAPPGLPPLGAKGSGRDRLRLPDGLRAPPRVVIKYRSVRIPHGIRKSVEVGL